MGVLSYETLREQSYPGFLLKDAPERALQFGEGGFLRAFADTFIDIMNEKVCFNAKIAIVQPIAKCFAEGLTEQEGLYTVCLRGLQEGERVRQTRVISCVSRIINPYAEFQTFLDCARNPELRFILTNTTEAGIVYDENARFDDAPPAAFPAKLTRLLYERYSAGLPGFIILSCELIDNNGKELLRCVESTAALWKLPAGFCAWLRGENIFCSTLVDRIVTGYPHGDAEEMHRENGYTDRLLCTAEPFGLWVIEGPPELADEFPAKAAGLPVIITEDHSPYKQQKVRILNGAHTALVHAACLYGKALVRECMDDTLLRSFTEKTVFSEIMPTLTLPEEATKSFAAAVFERFANPFIDHKLLSISLNSAAKWKARLFPSLQGYAEHFGRPPLCIVTAFAAFLAFARKESDEFPLLDDPWVCDFFRQHRDMAAADYARKVCEETRLWDKTLVEIPGFVEQAGEILALIEKEGVGEALRRAVEEL